MRGLDNIIGYEDIKSELALVSDVLSNGEAYQRLGVSPPRGMLFHGKPGVGKTLMATSLIQASGRRAIVCRKDIPNGDFVMAVKKTFQEAVEAAPSIVFLDDMDKFANEDEFHPDAEEYVTVQSCIDEVAGRDVFVLATANDLESLPKSLLRPGRIDRVIQVDCPKGDDAAAIVGHYLSCRKVADDMDARTIARIMDGCSCAELETVINEAGLYAGFERAEEISMDHFLQAYLHTMHDVPLTALKGAAPVDLADRDMQMTQVIFHEAGHAVVTEVLDPGCITLVCAWSRGRESGGFTSYCHSEALNDFQLQSIETIGSLGAMAALEHRFGIVDVGSSQDLDRAFLEARKRVAAECLRGLSLHGDDFDMSPELRSRQEQATAAEIEGFYMKAKEIIAANQEFLTAVAEELAAKSVLTADDISRIRDGCRITTVRLS